MSDGGVILVADDDDDILLLTAKAQEQDVRRGFAAGADAYMKKPFSPAELATKVHELIQGQDPYVR